MSPHSIFLITNPLVFYYLFQHSHSAAWLDGTCGHLHRAMPINFEKFVTKRDLKVPHFIFITLDNVLFGPIKEQIMSKDKGKSLTEPQRLTRDATLELIEEFQATEVPLYDRIPRAVGTGKGLGDFDEKILKHLCAATHEILKVFGDAYLEPNAKIKDQRQKDLREFYNKEVQKRIGSDLARAFRYGREAITKINNFRNDMQKIHNKNPKNLIPEITTVVLEIKEVFSVFFSKTIPTAGGS